MVLGCSFKPLIQDVDAQHAIKGARLFVVSSRLSSTLTLSMRSTYKTRADSTDAIYKTAEYTVASSSLTLSDTGR